MSFDTKCQVCGAKATINVITATSEENYCDEHEPINRFAKRFDKSTNEIKWTFKD